MPFLSVTYGYLCSSFQIDDLRRGFQCAVGEGDGFAVHVVCVCNGTFDGQFAVDGGGGRPDGADNVSVG